MSTLLTTTNNGFQYPTAANNGADFATGVADLANSLDAMWLAPGAISARPAASTVPRFAIYTATDTGLTYQSDGVSAWLTVMLAGAWSNLTINTGSGFAADESSDVTPAARIVGDTVQLCGGIVNSEGTGLYGYTDPVFTLPAGMAPATQRLLGVVDPNDGTGFVLIVTASTGVVYGSRTTWPPGGRCPLDGASFRLI